jgi:hypothetical protein
MTMKRLYNIIHIYILFDVNFIRILVYRNVIFSLQEYLNLHCKLYILIIRIIVCERLKHNNYGITLSHQQQSKVHCPKTMISRPQRSHPNRFP